MTQLFLNNEKNDLNFDILLNDEQTQKLMDINKIQENLIDCVEQQNLSLDRIENNISTIHNNIECSLNKLKEADKNYINYSPIILGGIVGSILISPIIGLVGIKTGTLFSISGGIIGGLSGYSIQ